MEYGGTYYLYYMGTRGEGRPDYPASNDDPKWWIYRNNQRIGVAVASHPSGPWLRMDKPILDVTSGSWDHQVVNNPTVTRSPDGKFIMIYKGVGPGPMPKGGAVVCGVAVADHPLGPFRKVAGPIMVNPENGWSVEDPYIWYQEDRFYALVKDFQGHFTKQEKASVALFESSDGIEWNPSDHPHAFNREIYWEDGTILKLNALERPQIWLENGKPKVLFCAAAVDEKRDITFLVPIPLN